MCLKIKIKTLIMFTLFAFSCSSLPVKEFELAKTELDKAKVNEAPAWDNDNYTLAESFYQAAEKYMKEKEGEKAKNETQNSIVKSRSAILLTKDKRTLEQIQKVEKLLASIEKSDLADMDASQDLIAEVQLKLDIIQKLKPAKELLDQSKIGYQEAKLTGIELEKNAKKTEVVPEVDKYIEQMDKAFQKAKDAEAAINAELEILKKSVEEEAAKRKRLSELNGMISKGDEMIAALLKDAFVTKFYSEERQKVIDEFMTLRAMIMDKKEEEAEKNKALYDNLLAFFEKMKAEKLSMASTLQRLSDRMTNKIKDYYRIDAESYLEKANRIREEVYKRFGKDLQEMKMQQGQVQFEIIPFKEIQQQVPQDIDEEEGSDNIEGKEESISENPDEKKVTGGEEKTENLPVIKNKENKNSSEKKKSKPVNAEDAMFNQLDTLYQDAQSLFEKEEYKDSVEKAKEMIELGEKMLLLKKGGNNDFSGENFQLTYKIVEYKSYTVTAGDCMWKIAMRDKVFGKAYLWPLIWYANKDKVKDPDWINPGQKFKIPVFK